MLSALPLLAALALAQGEVPIPAAGPEAERAAAWTLLAARFDADGDGAIVREELTRGPEAFIATDRDFDGRITPRDFGRDDPGRGSGAVPGWASPLAPGESDPPRPGDFAPELELVRAGELAGTVRLDRSEQAPEGPRGRVLVFGSLTDPGLRAAAPRLAALAREHASSFEFLLVYQREAHALDSWDPGSYPPAGEHGPAGLLDPLTHAEREVLALRALDELALPFPAAVDGLDDRAARRFRAFPSRVYVLGPDGRVAFAGAPGITAPDLEGLALLLRRRAAAERAPDADGAEAQGMPPSSQTSPPARGARSTLFDLLDTDGDGRLGQAEIEAASEVLRGCDANGDGALEPEELGRVPRDADQEQGQDVRKSAPENEAGLEAPAPALPPARPAPRGKDEPEAGAEAGLEALDSDRDGRLSRIEVPRPWLDVWEAFDRNGDGYLDPDERPALETWLEERRRR